MDEIIITPPYNEENCKANASSAAPLARVKKVVSTYTLCHRKDKLLLTLLLVFSWRVKRGDYKA
jgi:hypothetical protein